LGKYVFFPAFLCEGTSFLSLGHFFPFRFFSPQLTDERPGLRRRRLFVPLAFLSSPPPSDRTFFPWVNRHGGVQPSMRLFLCFCLPLPFVSVKMSSARSFWCFRSHHFGTVFLSHGPQKKSNEHFFFLSPQPPRLVSLNPLWSGRWSLWIFPSFFFLSSWLGVCFSLLVKIPVFLGKSFFLVEIPLIRRAYAC